MNIIKYIIANIAILLSLMTFSGAYAAGLGTAGNYNVFVFNNFSAPSSDIEGRLAAGGDVSINYYSIGDKLTGVEPADYVLVAGGNITFPSGKIYYGSAIAEGSVAGVGSPVLNGMAAGATVTGNAVIPINFTTEENYLTTLSRNLADETANGTYVFQWGGFTLTGDNANSVQVFQLNGADVKNANSFTVTDIPADATVIFNISGTAAGLSNFAMTTLESIRTKVLFNFYEATTLTLGSISVEGSILAPLADITTQWGVVRGTVMSKSWNGPMQVNHNPFTGDLPEEPTLIRLASFSAAPKSGEVIISWSTESESDNAGFNLYRADDEDGAYKKINDGLIPAEGAFENGYLYEFTDIDVKNRKTYYYKLEDIDLNGFATMHGPVSATPRLLYELFQ